MANEIDKIFNTLPEEKKRELRYAREYDIAQYVILEGGRYIGVNCKYNRRLIPELQIGIWSIGRINNNGVSNASPRSEKGP